MSESKNQLTRQEKARRWDALIEALGQPQIRDTYIHHLTAARRAVILLLAEREELPPSLVVELKSYKVTLDALYLEVADGWAECEGILNLFPTYVTESIVGNLCQFDANDD
jgi:hypothetical protein